MNDYSLVVKKEQKLSNVEVYVINAAKSSQIRDLTQEQLIDFVGIIFTESLITLGHKNTFQNSQEMASAQMLLINNLIIYESSSCIEEVRMAVQMGITGKLDVKEKGFFSVANVMIWIEAYKDFKKRTLFKASELQKLQEIEEIQNNKKRERKEFLVKTLQSSYEYVKNRGKWIDFEDNAYRYAFETLYGYTKKFLNYSQEQFWEHLIQSRREIKENVIKFENEWKHQDFMSFLETIEEKTINKKNFFHMKSVFLTRERLFKISIEEILKLENHGEIIENIKTKIT